jgi:predicted component of type VI protein secretion system
MWSLKVVKGAELAEQLQAEVRLPQPLQRFGIGRDPGNSWAIADRSLALSARHCEIVATPDGPALRDLSTNGTFVNGEPSRLVGEHLLRDGDRLLLGPFEILVSGPPSPVRPPRPVRAAAAPTPARPFDTAVQRGGDPAAMLAAGGGPGRLGLTEILRAAPPAEDSVVELTRIRDVPVPVPSLVPAPAPMAVPAPIPAPAPVTPAVSAPAADPPTKDLAQALARGLGLPVQALQGQDLLVLVEQLAAAARRAQQALQQLPSAGPAAPRR